MAHFCPLHLKFRCARLDHLAKGDPPTVAKLGKLLGEEVGMALRVMACAVMQYKCSLYFLFLSYIKIHTIINASMHTLI